AFCLSNTAAGLKSGMNARPIFFRTALMLVATALPFIALKLIFPGGPDTYVSMTFHGHKLLSKLLQYATSLPDYFAALSLSLLAGGYILFSGTWKKMGLESAAFFSLLISTIVATAALISFDSFASLLLYIWMP